MDDKQYKEIEQLRLQLCCMDDWDPSTLNSLFRDFLQDRELCNKLISDIFIEAVSHCAYHQSNNRDDLIKYLLRQFTQAGNSADEASSLASIALYLGQIDSELTPVETSQLVEREGDGGHGKPNGQSCGKDKSTGSSDGNGDSKRKVRLLIALIVAAVLCFIIVGLHKNKVNEVPNQRVFDVCLVYEGKTTTDEGVKNCKLSICHVKGNEVKLTVTNICDPDDVDIYTGNVRKNEIIVFHAPDLTIKSLPEGGFILSGKDKRYGEWYFQKH